ncbi:S-4TM family putative pore-forming effector [Escherichia coli]
MTSSGKLHILETAGKSTKAIWRRGVVRQLYDAPQANGAPLPRKKSRLGQIAREGVYCVFYLSAFIVSPVAMLVYGVVMKSGLNEILFYVVFTLPVIRYFLLQFLDNRSSMKRSEKLKKYVEKELSGIRLSEGQKEEQLAYTLRNIQDEMFTYRASCPPVPNGIQLIMKPKNERIYVDYFETNLKELHLQK